jgi:GNAT superfamily N-acetyltransferase
MFRSQLFLVCWQLSLVIGFKVEKGRKKMIRKGKIEDIESIMKMVHGTVQIMREEKNDQWDEIYPVSEHFESDWKEESLFVMEENGEILGSITIDQHTPDQYNTPAILWRSERSCFTFHRLVVDPFTRGKGVASKLISHAEEIARQNGISYMKTDTYSLNKKAQALFEKNGYKRAGKMFLQEKVHPFYCYDKIVLS